MEHLKLRQDKSREASGRMLEILLNFDACQSMQIGDAKYIANTVQTLVLNAIEMVDREEGR